MALTVMTWNIEQFGTTRTGYLDNMTAITRIINAADPTPDIIVLIEIKTTKPKQACIIAESISNWVYEASNRSKEYKYIISFNNNMETYVYLYLVSATVPITLAIGYNFRYNDDPNSSHKTLSGLNFNPASGKNSSVSYDTNTRQETILNAFPLVQFNKIGNCRPPAVGFFLYNNQVIAIVAWHNMSGNDNKSYRAMKNMSESWFVANKKFRIKINNSQTDVENILITGDFNYDICEIGKESAYSAFNGFTTYIKDATILRHYIYIINTRIKMTFSLQGSIIIFIVKHRMA